MGLEAVTKFDTLHTFYASHMGAMCTTFLDRLWPEFTHSHNGSGPSLRTRTANA
jgi:hypothetical protein